MRNRCDIDYYYRSQYAGRAYIYRIICIIKCMYGVDVTRELIDFPEGNLKTNSNGVGTYTFTGGATVARAAACYILLYAHGILFCVCNYCRAWGIAGTDIKYTTRSCKKMFVFSFRPNLENKHPFPLK